jgi:hypothetical protein
MGGSDPLGVTLMVVGVIAAMVGIGELMPKSSPPGSAKLPAPAVVDNTRSVEGRLRELEDLHQKGVITAAEYDAKRAEVLAAL